MAKSEAQLLEEADALDKAYAEAASFDAEWRSMEVKFDGAVWSKDEKMWEARHPEVLTVLRQAITEGEIFENPEDLRIDLLPPSSTKDGTIEIFVHDGHLMADVIMLERYGTASDAARSVVDEMNYGKVVDPGLRDRQIAHLANWLTEKDVFLGVLVRELIDFGEDPTIEDFLTRVYNVETQLCSTDRKNKQMLVGVARELLTNASLAN